MLVMKKRSHSFYVSNAFDQVTKRTGWIRCNVKGPESIADHMYRMGMMSLIAGDAGVNTDRSDLALKDIS